MCNWFYLLVSGKMLNIISPVFSLVFLKGNWTTFFESFSSSSSPATKKLHEQRSGGSKVIALEPKKKLVELGIKSSDVDCGECAWGTRQNRRIRSAKKCNKHRGQLCCTLGEGRRWGEHLQRKEQSVRKRDGAMKPLVASLAFYWMESAIGVPSPQQASQTTIGGSTSSQLGGRKTADEDARRADLVGYIVVIYKYLRFISMSYANFNSHMTFRK